MMTTLFLTTILFAPAAPAPAAPPAKDAPAADTAPAGLPPRILELKPNTDGKIMLPVTRPVQNAAGGGGAVPGPVPGAPGARPNIIMMGRMVENVELANIKDLTITTAAGKEVTREEALKTLAKGGTVVVSADGQKISPAYLKMFKDEVLVLAAPELAAGNGPQFGAIMGGVGAIRLVPAAPALPPAPAVPPPAPNK